MYRCLLLSLIAAAGTLSGCMTPLGGTRFPIVSDPAIEGVWHATMCGDASDSTTSPAQFHVAITSTAVTPQKSDQSAQTSEATIFRDLLGGGEPDDRYMFHIYAEADATAKSSPDLTLVGQLVRLGEQTFVTLQPSINETLADKLTGSSFAAPLQQTYRITRHGEEMTLDSPRVRLVWTPVPLANPAALDRATLLARQGDGMFLAASPDEIFEYLDSLPDSEWVTFARAKRVSDVR